MRNVINQFVSERGKDQNSRFKLLTFTANDRTLTDATSNVTAVIRSVNESFAKTGTKDPQQAAYAPFN